MRTVAVAVGLGLDAVLGEPPAAVHPVVHFGRAVRQAEARWWAPSRTRGAAVVVAAVGTAAAGGVVLDRLVGRHAATAAATGFAIAGRMLAGVALDVERALVAGDLARARELLPSLCGRDPTTLDEAEISRAVVESVAENTVDAVLAPLWWAAIGGAPGVLAHRAVNTLDAMIGHRSERYAAFGWAAARLDDVAAWPAARLGALAVAAVSPGRRGEVLATVRRDARRHPSPNGGVVEAAAAGALGLRLGGVQRYGDRVESRGPLGDGRAAVPTDIGRAVALMRRATVVVVVALVAADSARTRGLRFPRRRRCAGR